MTQSQDSAPQKINTNTAAGVTLDIVLICGTAGAGKTTASDALEDSGYFCVDNVPVFLIASLVDFSLASGGDLKGLGLVASLTNHAEVQQLLKLNNLLRSNGHRVQLLFIDAKSEVLMRRFSQTRRPHPFDPGGGALDRAILRERQVLAELRQAADQMIDSSELSRAMLRTEIRSRFADPGSQDLVIALQSFGFKYGVPRELNFLFDARFLPNPYFVETLREGTGKDPEVAEFVLQHVEAQKFLTQINRLIMDMIPHYRAHQTRYITVAIACTGGRHRSVALVEALHRDLTAKGLHLAQLRHRDIEK